MTKIKQPTGDTPTTEEEMKAVSDQYYRVLARAAAGAMKGSPSWGMVYAIMSAANSIEGIGRAMMSPPVTIIAGGGQGLAMSGEEKPKAN